MRTTLVLLLPLSALALAKTAPPSSSVVRIEVAAVAPAYLRPWEKSPQMKMTGSGFIIDGRRILTNHHVIEDAVDIRLQKHGSSRRWPARVITAGPDVDLALLEVITDAEDFFSGTSAVVWSDDVPALQERVSVRGYPAGGSSLCTRAGFPTQD